MSRKSANEYREGRLWGGYDYERQAWAEGGRYLDCGHPEQMNCGCYGRLHEGEDTIKTDRTQQTRGPTYGAEVT